MLEVGNLGQALVNQVLARLSGCGHVSLFIGECDYYATQMTRSYANAFGALIQQRLGNPALVIPNFSQVRHNNLTLF